MIDLLDGWVDRQIDRKAGRQTDIDTERNRYMANNQGINYSKNQENSNYYERTLILGNRMTNAQLLR